MSLMLAAAETKSELAGKIRARIQEGANVREVAELPTWFAAEVGNQTVAAAFESEHAAVAILENGRTLVRRAPKH